MATLLDLLERARPDHPAIVVPDGARLTYRDLRAAVLRAAETLARLGIGRGDRVALALPNGAEAIVSFLAAAHAGVAAPLNPSFRDDEFRYALGDSGARALIVGSHPAAPALRARPSASLVLEARITAERTFRLRGAVPLPHGPALVEPAADDQALVLHSSGTTGRPKRVALTHTNLLASIERIVETLRLGPDDVGLCVMPLFHVHGLVAGALAPLAAGGTVVVPTRFAPASLPQLAREHRVTWWTAVPTIHQLVLARARDAGAVDGLRFVRSASAKLPAQARLALEERFGAEVLEAYGMTEAAHQIASNPLRPGLQRAGSVGLPTGVEVAIMDERGARLALGGEGEVVLRGPNVIQHYDDDAEADARAFHADGWLRTGDIGRFDRDGYLTLVGRSKEMINRGGEKISPAEIDDVLLGHPAVAEAISFGVPHPTWGETVAAAVVLRADASARDLIRHCRERLAPFKVPARVHIVDELPRTATGKVQRIAVAKLLEAQAA